MLKIGSPLPQVSGQLSDGSTFDFGAPSSGPLVIFFFPKAFTPTCTKEACGFRDAHEELVGVRGAKVLGVSRDAPETNRRFRTQYQLPYELVSDVSGAVAKAFDAQLFGGLIPYAQRVTYVTDRQGIIRGAFKGMFEAQAHLDEAKSVLKELAEG